MKPTPRVALFTDSFHEINGVGLTSRQLEAFARRNGFPMLCVRGGPRTVLVEELPVRTLELRKSRASFSVDRDLRFDPLLPRYHCMVESALRRFSPDLVHVTSPGDIGILGVWMAHRLGVPLVASWHTNVHEFAARRLERMLRLVPLRLRAALVKAAERAILSSVLRFYRIARAVLAPNLELVRFLRDRNGKPAFLMQRGVDTALFSPARRNAATGVFTIGFVGRLEPEKNVRFLADIERALLASGEYRFRFLVVGGGSETVWLRNHLQNAEFPGVLVGEDLARAYAGMDLFVFPSHTDTFGNVVLEAMASGVPAVVTDEGGPKFLVRHDVSGFVAASPEEFKRCVLQALAEPWAHAAMRVAARREALHRSWDRVFEGVYEAYRSCLAWPPPQLDLGHPYPHRVNEKAPLA